MLRELGMKPTRFAVNAGLSRSTLSSRTSDKRSHKYEPETMDALRAYYSAELIRRDAERKQPAPPATRAAPDPKVLKPLLTVAQEMMLPPDVASDLISECYSLMVRLVGDGIPLGSPAALDMARHILEDSADKRARGNLDKPQPE